LRNFYDMLSVAPNAPPDEIKKAFRREIARYHPDKVQHLGREFQEMASGIAADLTEAYRILMDPALRTKYDEDLGVGGGEAGHKPPPRPPSDFDAPAPPPPSSASSSSAASSSSSTFVPPPSRPSSSAGTDFVKKASLSRLRAAVDEVLGSGEPVTAPGFDIAVTSKPKRGLFKKADDKVRLLVRFVPMVDAQAVEGVWVASMKAKGPDAILCVMLAGPALAPSKDLATAISEQRRKTRNAGPVLVPVDVRDWEALFPPDTPAIVRSLIQRLKEDQR
jgi:hypothetical protein